MPAPLASASVAQSQLYFVELKSNASGREIFVSETSALSGSAEKNARGKQLAEVVSENPSRDMRNEKADKADYAHGGN